MSQRADEWRFDLIERRLLPELSRRCKEVMNNLDPIVVMPLELMARLVGLPEESFYSDQAWRTVLYSYRETICERWQLGFIAPKDSLRGTHMLWSAQQGQIATWRRQDWVERCLPVTLSFVTIARMALDVPSGSMLTKSDRDLLADWIRQATRVQKAVALLADMELPSLALRRLAAEAAEEAEAEEREAAEEAEEDAA